MGESNALASVLLSKLEEQIELADRLIALVPPNNLEYKPLPDSFRVCDLLGHLLECLAGFCATLYAVNSDRLADFVNLRELPVNHCCGIEEARDRLRDYEMHIKQGFALVSDDDLARRVPTVFVPEGEAGMTILLGNFEHFLNHKYQLFFYLKLLEAGVTTSDLYRLR